MSESNASQFVFRAAPNSGVVDLIVEHAEPSSMFQLEVAADEIDALAWAVWFSFPGSKQADVEHLEHLGQRIQFLRRSILQGGRFEGKNAVVARLGYRLLGTSEECARRLNEAAEPLNDLLRELGG